MNHCFKRIYQRLSILIWCDCACSHQNAKHMIPPKTLPYGSIWTFFLKLDVLLYPACHTAWLIMLMIIGERKNMVILCHLYCWFPWYDIITLSDITIKLMMLIISAEIVFNIFIIAVDFHIMGNVKCGWVVWTKPTKLILQSSSRSQVLSWPLFNVFFSVICNL